MDTPLAHNRTMSERNRALARIVARERTRLINYVRRRVPSPEDADDIVQDVFYELVEAYRLPEAIEQIGAWLFRVAHNRIVDHFRRARREGALPVTATGGEDAGYIPWDLLPAPEAEPEAAYTHAVLLEALGAALDELPPEQRTVFIAHELEGRSFKTLSAETGLSVNTLLARKRYAVLYLRRRLQDIHDEFISK